MYNWCYCGGRWLVPGTLTSGASLTSSVVRIDENLGANFSRNSYFSVRSPQSHCYVSVTADIPNIRINEINMKRSDLSIVT